MGIWLCLPKGRLWRMPFIIPKQAPILTSTLFFIGVLFTICTDCFLFVTIIVWLSANKKRGISMCSTYSYLVTVQIKMGYYTTTRFLEQSVFIITMPYVTYHLIISCLMGTLSFSCWYYCLRLLPKLNNLMIAASRFIWFDETNGTCLLKQ